MYTLEVFVYFVASVPTLSAKVFKSAPALTMLASSAAFLEGQFEGVTRAEKSLLTLVTYTRNVAADKCQ